MIPTTATLEVMRRQVGATDPHGNPVITYGPEEPWPIWGRAPGANVEAADPNRDLSMVEWTIYAPTNAALPGELDRVVVDGDEFEVEGRFSDWTRGPWYVPAAGAVVLLRRPEG